MSVHVLLRADVEGLGRTGDIVEVAPGYARNYLEPNGLAIKATPGVTDQAERMRARRAAQHAADKGDAEAIATRLVTLTLSIEARASDEGRLFGSVASGDVVRALEAQSGIVVDAKLLQGEPVKELGMHTFMVKLHPEVVAPLNVDVVSG